MPEIVLQGRTVAYKRRTSARARRLQVKVDYAEGIELVVPQRGRIGDPESILRENAEWLLKQLDHFDALRQSALRPDWRDGGVVPLLGKLCPLRITEAPEVQRGRAAYQSGEIRVRLPADARRGELQRSVFRLYQEILVEILRSRVAVHSKKARVAPRKIAIRAQKTLWGSATAKGHLAFNWRLVLGPPEILDYVVAHEVAHLVHMDHSPAFHDLVESMCPGHRGHERWLRERGDTLRL